jgi:hypothetical protein
MTDRNEELNQLAEEAGLMVESLSELKERINSFHNAETQISSVSDSLVELIQTTSGQVEKASQILEMTAKVGIPELLEWIEPIYNDAKQVIITQTTLEGRISESQEFITNALTTLEENITATQGLITNAQAEYEADKAKYMSANRTHTIMLSLALLLGVAGIVLNFIQ